jgi:hypothetical protein
VSVMGKQEVPQGSLSYSRANVSLRFSSLLLGFFSATMGRLVVIDQVLGDSSISSFPAIVPHPHSTALMAGTLFPG